MELLLNELSIHEQFYDAKSFQEAVNRVMSMRNLARSFGREVYSSRHIGERLVSSNETLPQVLAKLPKDQVRSISRWFSKHGPFLEDVAKQDSDLYMEFRDEPVTDTAVGEAAYCETLGISRGLISFVPSDWSFSPICVRVLSTVETEVLVTNYLEIAELCRALQEAEEPISSWEGMESVSRRAFQSLIFSDECFSFLAGQPFAPSAAEQILRRLKVLDRYVGAVDSAGRRTSEGHQIYQDYFTGNSAWFSNSSKSEMHRFSKELTFPHPQKKGKFLSCTWHGKVNRPKIRIHFALPEYPGAPLFVVYIGLKITRK